MAPHLSIAERWEILTVRNDLALSVPDITSRLNCSSFTGYQILDLFAETNDVVEREGRGRKPSMEGSVRRQFREIIWEYPSATSTFVAEPLESRRVIRLSVRSIRR